MQISVLYNYVALCWLPETYNLFSANLLISGHFHATCTNITLNQMSLPFSHAWVSQSLNQWNIIMDGSLQSVASPAVQHISKHSVDIMYIHIPH